MLISAENRAVLLAKIHHLLNSARDSLQRCRKHYKRDFDRCLRKTFERINTEDYLLIDVLDRVNKTPKLEHAIQGRYRVLGQDQRPMVIQRKWLAQRITAKSVALASRPNGLLPTPPEPAAAINIQAMNLKQTPWLILVAMDHVLKDGVQLEFVLNWEPNYDNKWKLGSNKPKESVTVSKYFSRMREAMPDQWKVSSEVSPRNNTKKRSQQVSAKLVESIAPLLGTPPSLIYL